MTESSSEPKKYNTNPLDKRVADRAEAAMGTNEGGASEAPTREMPPRQEVGAPAAQNPTAPTPSNPPAPFAGPSAPLGEPPPAAWTAPMPPAASAPIAQAPPTHGLYGPPEYRQPPSAYAPGFHAPPAPLAPFAGSPQQQGPYPNQAQNVHGTQGFRPEGSEALGLKPNFAAMLAYTPFVGLVMAIVLIALEPPRNRFVCFHAKQALFAHVAFFVLWTVFRIAGLIVPSVVGWLLLVPQTLFILGVLAGFVVMMVKTYQGERFKIPVLGDQVE